MSDDAAARETTMEEDTETGRGPVPRYGTVLGTLVDVREPLAPVVEFEGVDGQVVRRSALTTVPIEPSAAGHTVVVMFVYGDPERPIITGQLVPGPTVPKKLTRTKTLVLEGRELVLEADSAITLRCGKASLTLTREGRLELRGTHVISHASGVNRIRGGTIKLN